MCGIFGFTTSTLPDVAAIVPVAQQMGGALRHRGPDDEGIHQDPGVVLGSRRLSIIDLPNGRQPIYSEDRSVVVVFNGEIYNFQQLRASLEASGHRFCTHTDTETIVHLYEEHGRECLDHLEGMFAFALWDAKEQELFLARDRMGEKPLYYHHSPRGLVFASELKGLLPHPIVERRLDLSSLNKYLTFEYVPAPHTIFAGVRKLEPGHYLVYKDGRLRNQRYWDIPLSEGNVGYRTEEEYAEELAYLLRESTRRRLVSDVPLGVFLSGGIDSSYVAALATQSSTSRIKTFSIGFQEQSFDESSYAGSVARVLGSEHHERRLVNRDMVDLVPRIGDILDEPIADASIIPTYLLSSFAVEHVKVALSGDGGDELFAGYPTFQAQRLVGLYGVLPHELRDVVNRLAARLPVSHKNISFDFKLKQFLRGRGVASEIRFFLWMGSFLDSEKRSLFVEGMRDVLARQNTFEDVIHYINGSGLQNDFDRLLYLCAKLYLQDDVLVKVDRASMANSLEVRAPYLDRFFVEFASRLPANYKLRRLTTKYLLKQAAGKVLPREIVHRRKKGFGIPLARWFTEAPLKDLLLDYLSEDRIRRGGLFDFQYIRTLLDEHLSFRRDNRKLLWTLLVFEMWKERRLP